MKLLLSALVAAGAATLCTVRAQGGSDDCINAATSNAISGPGTFAVNTTGATDSPETFGACVQPHGDVWFQWTSTATHNVTFRLCGYTTTDTVIAVYAGAGCPSVVPLACNDDSCNFQSSLSFAATSGSVYMLRIGTYNTAQAMVAQFDIDPPPTPGDDCSLPNILPPGPQTVPFNSAGWTTGAEGQTSATCLDYGTTAILSDGWYTWTPTASGMVEVSTCGLMTTGTDTRIAIYDGAGCPAAQAIACNDDAGHSTANPVYTCTVSNLNSTVDFNAMCGNSYTIQIGGFAAAALAGSFSIVQSGTGCTSPVVGFCFGDDSGTQCPCSTNPPTSGTVPPGVAGNGCPSSVNPNGANLTATGNSTLTTDTLVLQGSGMPNSSALYFQGTTKINAGSGAVFGDGLRCVGGTIVRIKTLTNVAGSSSYPGSGDPALHIKGAVTAPGTRYYQAWYRNAAMFCSPSTFNLTNGIDVTWM